MTQENDSWFRKPGKVAALVCLPGSYREGWKNIKEMRIWKNLTENLFRFRNLLHSFFLKLILAETPNTDACQGAFGSELWLIFLKFQST